MSRFVRNGFIASMAAIIAVGLGSALWPGARGMGDSALTSVRYQLGLGEFSGPVLVIFVQDEGAVASVRRTIRDDRVAAENSAAFALREGRIIAAGAEAASEIVSAAGWVDRELEIFHVRRRHTPASRVASKTAGSQAKGREPSTGNLSALLSKDELTHAEAIDLLDQI